MTDVKQTGGADAGNGGKPPQVPPGHDGPLDEADDMNDGSNAWPFGGDVVIEKTRHYPDEVRDLGRWFYEVCREDDIGMREAAKLLGYDVTVLSRFYRNKYEGSLKSVAAAIARYRERREARRSIQEETFVETSVSRDIWRICERASEYKKMALITGPTQIGKTSALEEFKRLHNHGTTKYVRLPSCAGVQLVAKEFASACRLSTKNPFEKLRHKILRAVDRSHCLIVDEVEQVFESYQKGSRMRILNFIREIYDRTHCGMVLCAAPSFLDEIESGNIKEMLAKLGHRCVFRLELPAPEKLPLVDITAFAKAYKLPAPPAEEQDFIRTILQVSGVGMFVVYLRAAGQLAINEKTQLTWAIFRRAHDIMNKGRNKKS